MGSQYFCQHDEHVVSLEAGNGAKHIEDVRLHDKAYTWEVGRQGDR